MKGRSNTILIAEDDEDEHEILTTVFTKLSAHYTLVFTTNGEETLSELTRLAGKKDLPVLIILDVNMPVKDGLSTLKAIRDASEYREVPIVMYSNSGLAPHVNACVDAGCTDYIVKPPLFNDVINSVKRMLQHIQREY